MAHKELKYNAEARQALEAGVDAVFAPQHREMYPPVPGADFSTWVLETQLSTRMEGRSRPTHFRGVTTVLAKPPLLGRRTGVFGLQNSGTEGLSDERQSRR